MHAGDAVPGGKVERPIVSAPSRGLASAGAFARQQAVAAIEHQRGASRSPMRAPSSFVFSTRQMPPSVPIQRKPAPSSSTQVMRGSTSLIRGASATTRPCAEHGRGRHQSCRPKGCHPHPAAGWRSAAARKHPPERPPRIARAAPRNTRPLSVPAQMVDPALTTAVTTFRCAEIDPRATRCRPTPKVRCVLRAKSGPARPLPSRES